MNLTRTYTTDAGASAAAYADAYTAARAADAYAAAIKEADR